MFDRRVQLLLDGARYQKVAQEANRRRGSISAVIRQAIDELQVDTLDRRQAIAAILAAEPMAVPEDPSALRREADAAH